MVSYISEVIHVKFCVWAKQTDSTLGYCFSPEIKVLNSVFTHSWHNGTWNVLAELINLETTVIKITVIALALVLSYFIRERSSKTVRFSVIQKAHNHHLSASYHQPSSGH